MFPALSSRATPSISPISVVRARWPSPRALLVSSSTASPSPQTQTSNSSALAWRPSSRTSCTVSCMPTLPRCSLLPTAVPVLVSPAALTVSAVSLLPLLLSTLVKTTQTRLSTLVEVSSLLRSWVCACFPLRHVASSLYRQKEKEERRIYRKKDHISNGIFQRYNFFFLNDLLNKKRSEG